MATLINYLPLAVFFLLTFTGLAVLAHEMGKAVGYEHGWNDHEYLTRTECRVWAGDDIIGFTNTIHNDWSK